ncbi:hypothetical protein D3C80_2146630 [compost metagenome]
MDEPQQNRRADNRLPGIAITKEAQFRGISKETQGGEHNYQIGDVGDHRAQPVTPGGTKAD